MKKIIIGFSTPKKWKVFPFIIRSIDNTLYSHSYWRFESSTWGLDFIYQNSGLHTNFMTSILFEKINKIIVEYEIEVTEEIYNKIGRLCALREGKNYAVLEIIGKGYVFLIRSFLKIFSKKDFKIKNPFSDGDKTTDCIQEASEVLRSGLNIKSNLDMDSVAIKPWHDFVSCLDGFKRRDTK